MSAGELRIGDAERDAAVSALGEHYAAGRLTKEEFDERSGRAWSARTEADLTPLFSDLPSAHRNRARTAPVPAPSGRRALPFLPILLIVVGLVLVTHVPWPVFLLLGWLWWSRYTRGRARPGRGSWA